MSAQETWPDWTAITTDWNGPYDQPDPDNYHVDCYRCQDAERTPSGFDGTRAQCVAWAQQHDADPEPKGARQ